MSENTSIEWADHSFSPWIGCTKVSAGCKNCYAENTTRARVLRSQGHETWGKGAKRSRTSAATWKNPVKWNRSLVCDKCGTLNDATDSGCGRPDPNTGWCEGELKHQRVFPSLCDIFDDEVPIEWLADFLKLIHDTPNLTWQLLTKRPENWKDRVQEAALTWYKKEYDSANHMVMQWTISNKPPDNIWIGTSCEDQPNADKRIPELLKIPATVRFLSMEPLLGAVEFSDVSGRSDGIKLLGTPALSGINWVICGGESGPGARPCNVEWIRSIVAQCKEAGVPCFVKQLGSRTYQTNPTLRTDILYPSEDGHPHYEYWAGPKDKKGGDMAEWPEDLRVREFPKQ